MPSKIEIATKMIKVYCRGNHEKYLCKDCRELILYMIDKADKCKTGELYCNNCLEPCYSLEMKERMTDVMKYSGPRMILYHPIISVKYMVDKKRRERKGA